ncbi:MAG: hypothetical protein ACOCVP_02830 [Wenzhouxiangella sp.]
MIFALIGALVILASPWIFLYFSPCAKNRPGLRRVNGAILAIAAGACALLALWIRQALAGSADFPWWPAVALAYSALLFPFLLLVGGLIRNFILFPDTK